MSDERRSAIARRMIDEVEHALENQTPAQVSSQFANYQKEFPKIFEMLLTRTYNHELLEMMLQQLERIESGQTSQHNASVAVGTVLVDEIVKPQLRNAGKKV
jgi:ABC-type transporter MlaC component